MKNKHILSFLTILVLLLIQVQAFNFDSSSPINVNIVDLIDGDAVTTISKEHYEIHEGDHYFVKTYVENTGDKGTSDYFSFTTPDNGKYVHLKSLFSPDTDVEITIYEDSTVSEGTPITGLNNDRNSLNTPTLTSLSAPTIDAVGDQIWIARNGGGRDAIGLSNGLNYEIIFKKNTTYIFKITKKTTSDTIIDINFWWYEEGHN